MHVDYHNYGGSDAEDLYQQSLPYRTFSGSEFVCTSHTYSATFRMILWKLSGNIKSFSISSEAGHSMESGSYTLKLKIEDEKKHQLTCASFSFDIGFGSSVSAM
ncbi:hypothetical protein Acr_26g0009900 [Actinidia rufa]|uniref:Uncharacterized protein n=1 Tax=Actinidia rufa TaxID=165716 RepID=A0A7J0H3P7_9ERIC|nr:hypothetical protein Acr_26g0009900 [Actinidia rufa]